MISAQRKSLNKSVDDLMPNTVEEASRRRSKPQDEMQRILAYNAQVLCWAYLCLVFPSESSQSL
jgi:hypothetical protein